MDSEFVLMLAIGIIPLVAIATFIIAPKKNRLRDRWIKLSILPVIGIVSLICLLTLPKPKVSPAQAKPGSKSKSTVRRLEKYGGDLPNGLAGIALALILLLVPLHRILGSVFIVVAILMVLLVAAFAFGNFGLLRIGKRAGRIAGVLLLGDAPESNENTNRCLCGSKEAKWKKFDLDIKGKIACPICGHTVCGSCMDVFYFPEKRELINRETFHDVGPFQDLVMDIYNVKEPPTYLAFHSACFYALVMHHGIKDSQYPSTMNRLVPMLDTTVRDYISKHQETISLVPKQVVQNILPFRPGVLTPGRVKLAAFAYNVFFRPGR
ncbi:MAG: hypothetical protein KJ970_13645 [Candidatus Eisenbacteria bacterium]|uniref:Uncharacterized protein n=1 Tax=Eiseniibacteriota bacterium TaxID=2212470 RepID=A0A948WDL0_UNCEI|nr:hypothetical protein [Candidatus Eisenbacteria bacterium]MBU1949681.1 hypothetical protein [Candidatus Eisenbacteria bacterium]MBU2691958.1 hypothetical protein [Candidatus Eisenbacteria bacterium]